MFLSVTPEETPMPSKQPDRKKPTPEKRRREIRTMRDAVDEIRVYGEEKPHSAEGAEKSPKPKKRRTRKKKLLNLGFLRLLTPEKRTRRSRDRKLTIFGRQLTFWPMFILAFLVLMVIVLFLNSANLTADEREVTLVGLPGGLEDYKILVLSDLNGKRFGDRQATLLREIGTLDYDIVVCLGDMVGKGGDPEPFYELLDGLPAKKPVYFICGDSDPGPYVGAVRDETATLDRLVLADWIIGATDRGAVYVDVPTKVSVGSAAFWLTPASMLNLEASSALADWKDQAGQEESGYLSGILSDKESLPFTSYRLQRAQALVDAINAMSPSDVQISLSHVPAADDVLEAAATHTSDQGKYLPSPDIALAGHYCGGVWNLPVLGAFYIPDSSAPRYGWFPDQSRGSGLRNVEETQVYVTRGLSTSSDIPLMPLRLLNSPQVSVITLTATLPTSMLE
jgi:predicted MPP superfamily phosphohydrolase